MKTLVFALTAAACAALGAVESPPVQAGCETKWNNSSRYTICRYGNTVSMRGFDFNTGSFWTQRCTNSGGGYSRCSGTDANGNFWVCRYTPWGRTCF